MKTVTLGPILVASALVALAAHAGPGMTPPAAQTTPPVAPVPVPPAEPPAPAGDLARAEDDLARVNALHKEGAASSDDVAQAQAAVAQVRGDRYALVTIREQALDRAHTLYQQGAVSATVVERAAAELQEALAAFAAARQGADPLRPSTAAPSIGTPAPASVREFPRERNNAPAPATALPTAPLGSVAPPTAPVSVTPPVAPAPVNPVPAGR